MVKNVLFFTNDREDYLADCLLHGLRQLAGVQVIDYPKKEVMYKKFIPDRKLYGNGFTIFRSLDEATVDRDDIEKKIGQNFFEIIIFSSIHRQLDYYFQYQPYLSPRNTVFVDGEDRHRLVYQLDAFSKIRRYSKLRDIKNHLYLKRELYDISARKSANVQPISFAFPGEKMISSKALSVVREKDFPAHIVDREIAQDLGIDPVKYVFESEFEYYNDLRLSRFGITLKKGGWDCMRHYEIAANGAVPCFRDLSKKPRRCAPHGLVHGLNCIDYANAYDLRAKIDALRPHEYRVLQENAYRWVQKNTTRIMASSVLRRFATFRRMSVRAAPA